MRKKDDVILKSLKEFIFTPTITKQILAEKLGVNYTTSMRRLNDLVKMNAVTESEKIQSNRGAPKQGYEITDWGIICYFLLDPKNAYSNFEQIAEMNRDKFVVFEWWPTFKEKGLDKIIFKRFTKAMNQEVKMLNYKVFLQDELGRIMNPKNHGGVIDYQTLGFFTFGNGSIGFVKNQFLSNDEWDDLLKIWSFVFETPELKGMLEDELKRREKRARENLRNLEEWMSFDPHSFSES